MYDTILIPTDGSEHAVRAAEHGRYLADAFDATVHVVNVVDVRSAAGLFDAGGVEESFVARLEAEGQRSIEAVEDVFPSASSVRTAIVRGDPTEAILEYADDRGVDAVAMGTHGRTGLDRYAFGSVTEAVVRRSKVPVLTVRATDRSEVASGYEEILLPTDGSDHATAAYDHGLELARRAGARVHAVSIGDVDNIATSPDFIASTAAMERLESVGDAATEEIEERAEELGVAAVSDVREGHPASGLLEYVEEHDVDLVAMGTAGRTGLDRYLLGSTTERIVRHAAVPVLAVDARDRPEG